MSIAILFLLLCTAPILVILKATWLAFSSYYLNPMGIQKAMARQGVGGPRPSFLTGNLQHIASLLSKTTSSDMDRITHDIVPRLLPHYLCWSKQYGKRFLFWYGTEARLCLTDAHLVKDFLSSKHAHVTGRSWLQRQGSRHLIGRGLIMANGHDWFQQRRIIAPTFMGFKLKAFMGYVVECTDSMLRSIHDVVGDSTESEVEIGGYMTKLTGDVISRAGFGSSYDKGRRIFQLLQRLQHLTAQSTRHLWFPGSRFFPTKFHREIKTVKEEMDGILMEIIQKRIEGLEIGRSCSYDSNFLGTILGEPQEDAKKKMPLDLIMDECKTIYFAGHESSAMLLTWTVMLLATNPAWQHKAREEVGEIFRGEPPSTVTTEHLSKLNLLNMIINESLRLYPPVAMLPRMAFEDIKLGDALHIPKGLSVWIPVLAIHHNKEIWGNDADEFNPERWSGKSSAQIRNFLPFAGGPRNCIGQAFAVMEAKIILAMLVTQFSFTISDNYRHAPINVLTLRPKHGVPIILTPIK